MKTRLSKTCRILAEDAVKLVHGESSCGLFLVGKPKLPQWGIPLQYFIFLFWTGLSTVVIGELLAGFRCGKRMVENHHELEKFLDSPRVVTLAIDEETAEFYARIFRELREKGKPVPTNDLWIAATAMQHGYALATHDTHFSTISGIITVDL